MVRNLAVFVVLALVAATSARAGIEPGTGVVGSKHDINLLAGARPDEQKRVCAFCHTPHHALPDPTGEFQPLWSHQYTSYVANFLPYRSPTLEAEIIDPLMGSTRLCMSCHDGVVAVDQHYGYPGAKVGLGGDGWGGGDIGAANTAGFADFSNDHPIGFSYLEAQREDVGGGLFIAAGRTFLGNDNNPALTIEDVLLDGEFMTCASCHDVHNKDNASHGTATGVNYFLLGTQENSGICLTCHNKGNGVDQHP